MISTRIKPDEQGLRTRTLPYPYRRRYRGWDIGDYRDLDGNIPIIMTNLERDDIDVHALESINIFSQMTGNNVPLIQVANI